MVEPYIPRRAVHAVKELERMGYHVFAFRPTMAR